MDFSLYRDIGARLRLIRATLNISETEAAEAHGVTVRTYRRYEAGKKQRGSGWLQFCERYEISSDYYARGVTRNRSHPLSINRGGEISVSN